MRIIGGALGGRKIRPPARMPYTRPTTDMAREGLFNTLENQLELPDLKVCDLFGGTGSISYEFCSRGVRQCTTVEKDPAMFAFIRDTAAALGLDMLHPVRMDVFQFIERAQEDFDLVFAGPPYAEPRIAELPDLVFRHEMLRPGGWFILEHTPDHDYRNHPGFAATRRYGTTVFSIFVRRDF